MNSLDSANLLKFVKHPIEVFINFGLLNSVNDVFITNSTIPKDYNF